MTNAERIAAARVTADLSLEDIMTRDNVDAVQAHKIHEDAEWELYDWQCYLEDRAS